MILIWMFFLGLYTISIFTKRPIKPYATAIVGGGLMIVVFIGSTAEWFAMPVPPPTSDIVPTSSRHRCSDYRRRRFDFFNVD